MSCGIKKRIMILGASILQVPAIQKAKEMGLEVVAVDMDTKAAGFQYADICLPISTIDIPAVVAAAKEYRVNGVITLASDMPMRTVAAVAQECGLVGIDAETALRATNKAVMRQALKDYCVPIPEFFKVSSKDEYNSVVEGFKAAGIKFIVKPADNSGSRGVYLVDSPDDEIAIEEAYHHSLQFSRCGDIVVEEYMEGPEVSVETLSIDGECHIIQITDKLTTGAPFFVEMGHSQPTLLSQDLADDISRVARKAVEAVGIRNGPSHTEIIATPNGAKIVELGARLGGDCITTHLVSLSTGMSMVDFCIQIALGERPEIIKHFSKGSAIRYFHQHAGIVRCIAGTEAAKEIPNVKQVTIIRGVGERITEIDGSDARMGFVIAQGDDADDAVAKCEKALRLIHVEIEQERIKI